MNAFNGLSVDSTPKFVFRTQGVKPQAGYDRDGVVAYSLFNTGATDAEVKCTDAHADVAAWSHGAVPTDQWMPLPAGKSVTLEAHSDPSDPTNQIDEIQVRCPTGTTTIGGGVTGWR